MSDTQQTPKRRVLTVLVDRANYGRLKPVMHAVDEHPDLELLTVCAGTMVLRRFDRPVRVVQEDGFRIDGEVFLELEGSTPVTMAKSVGFATIEFASEYQRLKPDLLLLIGDRYEAMGAALAAAYMNIPIVHMQGGEVSGSIDESARHAITKFAQFHCPATERSADYLRRMGERDDTILSVGCPASDLAAQLKASGENVSDELLNARGSGAVIDVDKPYALVVFHPTTTQYGGEREQMEMLLDVLCEAKVQTLMLWPNIDAGSDEISKAIRVYRDHADTDWLRLVTNFEPEDYLKVLATATVAVGNSSSFVRDAGFFGTPVVLVGPRQAGREADVHVKRAPLERDPVAQALREQLEHGRYAASTLYGDGAVGPRVAEAIATLSPYIQKQLAFAD